MVSSPISASPGQNCNFGKGYIQVPLHLFSHPYFCFWRCRVVLRLCLLLTLTTSPPTSMPCPELFQAVPTSSIFPSNISCLSSKSSIASSLLTANPGLIYLWIDKVSLHSGETFVCEGEQNLSPGPHYIVPCSSLSQKGPPLSHHIAGCRSWWSCITRGFAPWIPW